MEKTMDIDLILKVAGVGMLITVICQVMSKAGREEQSTLVSLAGTVLILILIAERIGELITTLRQVFGLCYRRCVP
jgi:stage III sporulation protein AC